MYNISGGIKAYTGNVAVGDQTLGLYLFSGKESLEETLLTAYSLEQGLQEFYLSMGKDAKKDTVKALFLKLADIEILHQNYIRSQYQSATGTTISRDAFEKQVQKSVLEGGMTTEEYLNRFNPNLESASEIISMAMSIEAQALDLYERAARNSTQQATTDMLYQISNEEKQHLVHLGKLMDSL